MLAEFTPFPKIPRLFRDITITEKIDGTNAQVIISEDGLVAAGSRTRYLTLDNDNYGFARWVQENKTDLLKLGPGRHFGEWWGNGIQRNYDLKEKRFSLFNVAKWSDPASRPNCCHCVPVLAALCPFDMELIKGQLERLKGNGSFAAPGFMKPEGIVVFHNAGHCLFKVTVENDSQPKSANE